MMTMSLAGGVLTVPEDVSNASVARAAELSTQEDVTKENPVGAPATENKDSGEKEKDIIDAVLRSPNGYSVIVKHGFNTVELFKKWDHDVELKRDDLRNVMWGYTKG